MAKDPKLTIQGDDGDGLRFDQCGWRKSSPSLGGGDAHPELARLMMERREEALEEIRARNLGVRVTRNSVTEPTSGTIAHRIWEIIDRLRKPDGSVDRHNFLKRRTAREGINLGTATAHQWSRWNRFHGMKGGEWGGVPSEIRHRPSRNPSEIRCYRGFRLRKTGSNRWPRSCFLIGNQ